MSIHWLDQSDVRRSGIRGPRGVLHYHRGLNQRDLKQSVTQAQYCPARGFLPHHDCQPRTQTRLQSTLILKNG